MGCNREIPAFAGILLVSLQVLFEASDPDEFRISSIITKCIVILAKARTSFCLSYNFDKIEGMLLKTFINSHSNL
jgi:hypothetical protein